MVGTIQPEVLFSVIDRHQFESGLSSRPILTLIDPRRRTLNDEPRDADLEYRMFLLFQAIRSLPMHKVNGVLVPSTLVLSSEAQAIWRGFQEDWQDAKESPNSDVRGVASKFEEVPARIALVIHLVRYVTQDSTLTHGTVDAVTMQNAVLLGRWFYQETLRTWDAVWATEPVRRHLDKQDRWLAYINGKGKGGEVSLRDFYRQFRMTAERGLKALRALEDEGLGVMTEKKAPNGKMVPWFKLGPSPE